MDYSAIVELIAETLKYALPLGIIFCIVERVVSMFFHFAFPKIFK